MPIKKGPIKFQLGKNGVTEGVIESLNLAFKTRKIVRISVLKNAVRDKSKVREMASEMAKKLGDNQSSYKCKIIGFTIILKKSSKKS